MTTIKNLLIKPKVNGYMVNTIPNPEIEGTNELEIIGLENDFVMEQLKGLQKGDLVNYVQVADGCHPYRCYQFANLQSADLRGATTVPGYFAYNCSNLETVTFDENTTNIGEYAFYQTNKLSNLVLPSSLLRVGNYAFIRSSPNDNTSYFNIKPSNKCYIGDNAFQNNNINELIGDFSLIRGSAFMGSRISKVDITSDYFENSCFREVDNIKNGIRYNMYVNISGKPTVLGSNAFSWFGSRRLNSTDWFNLDFSQGTFTSVGNSCFNGNSSYKNTHTRVRLPSSVTSIGTQAFQYNDYLELYMYGETPPTIQTNTFGTSSSQCTNLSIWVNYEGINAYKNATNWNTDYVLAAIKGFAPANTFTAGQTLPLYNDSGYACTWYSDKEMQNVVTVCPADSPELYCEVGTTKVAVKYVEEILLDASVSVVDNSDNSIVYNLGDMIVIGTTIKITSSPTDLTKPTIYNFTVNGSSFTSGDTFTIGQDDLSIIAVYWDNVNQPYNPVLSNNTPSMIKNVVDVGLHRKLWNQGGNFDTLAITLTDGTVTTWRLSDMQPNRYAKTDGSGNTNAVFECISILTIAQMDKNNSNVGGWAQCPMKTGSTSPTPTTISRCKTMNDIYNLLPNDWQAVISQCKVASMIGNYLTTISYSDNYLFLPAQVELNGNAGAGYIDEGYVWEYYVGTQSTDAKRIKQYNNSANTWWTRSPNIYLNIAFQYVTTGGIITNVNANTSMGVSPVFAI